VNGLNTKTRHRQSGDSFSRAMRPVLGRVFYHDLRLTIYGWGSIHDLPFTIY